MSDSTRIAVGTTRDGARVQGVVVDEIKGLKTIFSNGYNLQIKVEPGYHVWVKPTK
ncbi:MAG: hypothetical protein ABL893_10500 [Hyphomicrobium sp.]